MLQPLQRQGQKVSLSDPKVFEQVRNDLIARKLAFQEGNREGLGNSPDAKRQEAMFHQQLVSGLYFQKVAGSAKISDDQLKQAYDQAVKNHPPEEEMHVRQIIVGSEDDAKSVIKDLDGGADFAKEAKEKSTNKGNGQDGGDLGWMPKSYLTHLNQGLADAVTALQPNGYTKTPVKVGNDWYVTQLVEKRTPKLPTVDEAKPELKGQLERVAIGQQIQQLFNKAASSGSIKFNNLDGSPAAPPGAPAAAAAPATAAPAPTAPATGGTAAPLQLPQTAPQQ